MKLFGYIEEDQVRSSENSRTKLFLRLLRTRQNGGGGIFFICQGY